MILVCGEALFDLYLDPSDNPSNFMLEAHAGGSPYNVALGLARFGLKAGLLTGVSTDTLGQRITQNLINEGVSTQYLIRNGRRTTLSLVGHNAEGVPDYMFYGVGSADGSLNLNDLPSLGADVKAIHFGSYSLVICPTADMFAALVTKQADDHSKTRRFISLDPNIRPNIEPDMEIWRNRIRHYAQFANLVKISAEDMSMVWPGLSYADFAQSMQESGVRLVVITDGGNQVYAKLDGQKAIHIQPPKIKPIDTVGAGDSFQSALLYQLSQRGANGFELENITSDELADILRFAAKAAAITCSRKGADLPKFHEVV